MAFTNRRRASLSQVALVDVRPEVQEEKKAAPAPEKPNNEKMWMGLSGVLLVIVIVLAILLGAVGMKKRDSVEETYADTASTMFDANYCAGTKVELANFDCVDAVADAIEQAGANVTKGYVGLINNSATPPITSSYYQAGLCPVNAHWHLGAEHLSVGEYDEHGSGPSDSYADHRRLAGSTERLGYQCRSYDETDEKFTKSYSWEHCEHMMVGQTYEMHWPHSTVGACGTPYQYQSPFYDGVFCNYGNSGASTHDNVGVQSQTFVVVNDEAYYYPDLIKGAIVAATGDFWQDVAIYTGSTTGTSRDNDICSAYSPITWQVDRKCHLISASSFDKMCADMKSQVDDMSTDLYPHGARMLVDKELAAAQETRK